MATYKDAGVDLAVAKRTASTAAEYVRVTRTEGSIGSADAFGGFFEVPPGYRRPVLVTSVDGVGTKVKVAIRSGRHDTVGEDLVNHCVNDIAVCGAVPLYFVDYFAAGKLDAGVFDAVLQGIARGCEANSCALVGGETAEMPDLYAPGDYDLAGTIVGIVEKDDILDSRLVKGGDLLVGIPSSGLHTNGYTLARMAFFGGKTPLDVLDRPAQLHGASVQETLLTVHRSYLKVIRTLVERRLAHAFAHITGGGIEGNTRRIVRAPLTFAVDYSAWTRPAVFDFVQTAAEVPEQDMRQTFNLGIGLIAVVPPNCLDAALTELTGLGEEPVLIGRVIHP